MALNIDRSPVAFNNPSAGLAYYDSQLHSLSGSGSTTPSTASPTSPRDRYTSMSPTHPPGKPRQMRPPRVPNYIPAVLRPTDRPVRNPSHKHDISTHDARHLSGFPISPPSSGDNSLLEGKDVHYLQEHMDGNGSGERITRVLSDEWNDSLLEDVTGAPTRDHWKPDASSPTCDAPICASSFSLLRRRHHCRRCGNIFCSMHSPHAVPLDQHARFHPHGSLARACDSCWADFEAWRRKSARLSSTGSTRSGSSDNTDFTIGVRRINQPQQVKDMTVGSVPRDWSWSTF